MKAVRSCILPCYAKKSSVKKKLHWIHDKVVKVWRKRHGSEIRLEGYPPI